MLVGKTFSPVSQIQELRTHGRAGILVREVKDGLDKAKVFR